MSIYRRDLTSDSPSGCVAGDFFLKKNYGGGGGGGAGGLARRYQIASVICYVRLKV